MPKRADQFANSRIENPPSSKKKKPNQDMDKDQDEVPPSPQEAPKSKLIFKSRILGDKVPYLSSPSIMKDFKKDETLNRLNKADNSLSDSNANELFEKLNQSEARLKAPPQPINEDFFDCKDSVDSKSIAKIVTMFKANSEKLKAETEKLQKLNEKIIELRQQLHK